MALVRTSRRQPRLAFTPFGTANFPTFEDVENRMKGFLDRAFDEPFTMPAFENIGWMPSMDIIESPKEFTVTAELAGMDRKDIDITVENGILMIKGEKVEEKKEEDKKVYLYERNFGSFQRSFALPAAVDASKITAEFDKGVLKLHLPKEGDAKPKGHKVEIK